MQRPQRKWSSGELRRLASMAGTMPAAQVAARLGRPPASVEHMARRQGLSLAYDKLPGEGRCSECGLIRFTLDRSGRCAPCRHSARLDAIRARMASVHRELPPERRGVYSATEAACGRSRVDPAPARPDTSGMGPRAAARAEREWLRECELVEASNIRRRMRAAERRLERMEKSCREGKTGGNA